MLTSEQNLLVRVCCVIVILGLACGQANAQDTSHYPPGAEGIKGSTLPGPGLYLKW